MSYATYPDVFVRFPPIKTMVGTGTNDVATLDVSSVYCAAAEGIVNSYLANRYAIPLTTDPLITKITADLAIYDLGIDKMPRIPEYLQARYDRAIKLLEQLRAGELNLNPASQTLVTTGDNEAWSSAGSYHNIFSPVLKDIDQHEDADQVLADINARGSDVNCLC